MESTYVPETIYVPESTYVLPETVTETCNFRTKSLYEVVPLS